MRNHNRVTRKLVTIVGLAAFSGCLNANGGPSNEADPAQPLYLAHCAACHGPTLSGGQFGPSLRDAPVAAKWRDKRAQLLDFIKKNMPPADPGSLSDTEYGTLTDHILAAIGPSAPNEAAAGAIPGSVAAIQQMMEARHFGPSRADARVFDDETARRVIAERKILLDSLTPVSDSMLDNPPSKDWLLWRRTYETTSYSPLSELDRSNVKGLASAWSWSLPVSVNEIAPLVHDGVMFVNSANQVQALDAATGSLLWRYTRDLPAQFSGSVNQMQRSFAIWGSNLYLATADLHVIALDAKTGTLVWDREVVPPEIHGVMLSAGPVVVRGKVIQGVSSGLFCKGGCYVVGLDANTGRQIWRFDTTAKPGKIGGETWNDTPADDRYGGAVWVSGSYDPKTNLVYFGTGQTYHLYTLLTRHDGAPVTNGAGLFTDSTIALNPETGRLAWYHQHQPRDVWDLDESFERMLVSLRLNGQQRQLVLSTGKLGILDALDRTTGRYAFSIDLGLQQVITTIDPKSGKRTVNRRVIPEPYKTFEVCPSAEGVRSWMTPAYDSVEATMFFPMMEGCMDMTWRPNPSGSTPFERADIAWTLKPRPNSDGQYGRLESLNLLSRQKLWTRRFRAPLSSSLLLTKGRLLFSGDRDRYFRALDQDTGETLWQTRLNGVPNSSPITYSVGHRQFVAVVSGGGGPHDFDVNEMTPEIVNSTASTTIWVFALQELR